MGALGDRSGDVDSLSAVGQDRIRAHLEAAAASSAFASSARSVQLLRYLTHRALAGRGDQVNEYALGVDVFERPASFDPRVDSIVRSEMSRLRKRLKDYYADEGSASDIRIELPLRSYVPTFAVADRTPVTPQTPAEPRHENARRRSPVWVAAAVILLLAGVWVWSHDRRDAPPANASIAVLPFLNLSGDPAKEYLGDSVTDELTESLAETRDLRVVARTSSFQFKNKGADVREIGRKLNVTSVLEGSVQQRGDQFRVIAQLIRTADGFHLWSQTYDAPVADLQQVESDITRSSAQALLPAVRKSGSAARPTAIVNPQAHDLYLRAIYQLQLRTPESLQEGLALAEKAVQVDPSYVRAYGAIVRTIGSLEQLRLISPHEASVRSRAAVKKALELDPNYSDGHAWVAMDAYVKDWDWPRAEKEFKIALAAPGPHYAAENLYGWCLITRKRFQEARNYLQLAEDLDPLSPGSRSNMAVDLILERKFREAKRELDGISKLNPKSLMALRGRVWVALLEGNCTAAQALCRTASEWYPKLEDPTGTPIVKAVCGQPQAARRQLAEMDQKSKTTNAEFISPYVFAEAYGVLKDADHAIHYLEKSAEEHETTVLYLQIDTLLDPVRGDPRFIALERRLGLPQR